jgi:hypothetical protein
MTYYRLAIRDNQTSKWIWKSTVLTSLAAVLHLLRIYSPIPAERMRVFSSTCEEEIAELLKRENDGLVSGSLTAGEFLRVRRLSIQSAAAPETIEKLVRRTTVALVDSSLQEERPASAYAHTSSMDLLEQRRLQLELGPGGDHDTPYLCSLPVATPQLLAWIRLRDRMQAGDLQS